MAHRLASLALVLIIVGSVFAGIPLHSNEQECNMAGMAGMDCCKKAAQAESRKPENSTARLCCALNCSQPGTTGSTGTQLPRSSAVQPLALHPSLVQPLANAPRFSFRLSWADSPPPYPTPAYIRHLALLI
jgi:hypothetical protein